MYELGIQDNIHFHVIDWNPKFDALLGSEDLKRLGAKIDYQSNLLEIGNKNIPFLFEYSSCKLTPQKSLANNYISIPVSIEEGDVIFPELQLMNITIPECIVTAVQGQCRMPIDNQIEVNFTKRIPVTPLCETEILEPPRISEKPNFSEIIRTSHLNPEERKLILQICKKFNDIFYSEGCDFSFSNAVKHHIRTSDDEPVFVRSFRHPHSMKDEIQKQIQKLLDDKIIRPSISPYSAPVWIVPKN